MIAWGLLLLIIVSGIIAMVAVTPADEEWTRFLRKNRIDWFKDGMGDSLFEGEMIGGSDIPVLVMIGAGILYILAWLPLISIEKIKTKLSFLINWMENRPKLKIKLLMWRPCLGFILMSSLCIAMFVHSNKWTLGRARPKYVWEKGMSYSEWYEFGPYFVAGGKFRGSFPSGHTATVIALMALVYALIFSSKKGWIKFFGILTFIFTMVDSILMLLARSMSNAHWISDSTFSIFSGWLIIHVLYFWILKVPEQEDFYRKNHQPMSLPFFYEMQYTALLFITVLGIMATVIGLRALYMQNCPWLVAISPIGLAVIFFCFRLMKKIGFTPKSNDNPLTS